MSEQGYTSSENGQEVDDGLFCRNCSPDCRKIGYYLTFLVGIVIFVLGIIFFFVLNVSFIIVGSVTIILSPLWIKSPKSLVVSLRHPLRFTSLLIYLGFLAATIAIGVTNEGKGFLYTLFGILLGASGIWYFLSYFENGQQALITCCKTCFKKQDQPPSEP